MVDARFYINLRIPCIFFSELFLFIYPPCASIFGPWIPVVCTLSRSMCGAGQSNIAYVLLNLWRLCVYSKVSAEPLLTSPTTHAR